MVVKTNKPDKAAENLSKLRRLPADHPYIIAEISDINEQVIAEEATNHSSLLSNFKALVSNKVLLTDFSLFLVVVKLSVNGLVPMPLLFMPQNCSHLLVLLVQGL